MKRLLICCLLAAFTVPALAQDPAPPDPAPAAARPANWAEPIEHGADRTGLMSAMYRILEQGWTPADALKELIDGGYGYHSMWKNIVRYVRSVDADKLRAAIESAVPSTGSTRTVTDSL